ncbi:extensin family protein [Novosphingobium kaempferiae]|uniref:extensin family protein n=1 Tax=Novosphingobium kaempferiae TaxID=2896849 RepID=UPI001E409873|nr:extensin family protein [Novosphingobium kaempferiae]
MQPAPEAMLGERVVRLEHLGTANCRRIGGGETGNWSEHAIGNAIDIAAFVLADGRRAGAHAARPSFTLSGCFLSAVPR